MSRFRESAAKCSCLLAYVVVPGRASPECRAVSGNNFLKMKLLACPAVVPGRARPECRVVHRALGASGCAPHGGSRCVFTLVFVCYLGCLEGFFHLEASQVHYHKT